LTNVAEDLKPPAAAVAGGSREEAWARHLRLATLLSGDRHRGEDLLQDSLVRLYLRLGAGMRRWTYSDYDVPFEVEIPPNVTDLVPGK
jgi:DNA-directed RNA polymerase specialized sigma24 family protein